MFQVKLWSSISKFVLIPLKQTDNYLFFPSYTIIHDDDNNNNNNTNTRGISNICDLSKVELQLQMVFEILEKK